jgi:5-methylcytosine-specific restriction protein A
LHHCYPESTVRSVPEWVGRTDDSPVPNRVRLRVWERCGGRCGACRRELVAGDRWDCDHIVALALGGDHREGNLQALCSWCHKRKTRDDVAIKAYRYRHRLAKAGIKRRKYRPMPGSKGSPWKVTFRRGTILR